MRGGENTGTTELDSHANMAVVGDQAFDIQDFWRISDVNSISDELEKLQKVPIIDTCVEYDYPFSLISHFFYLECIVNSFVIWNEL